MGREISGRRPWEGKGRVERGAKLAYIKVQKREKSLGVFLHNFKKAFLARFNRKRAKQFGEMTESLNLLPLFARVLTVGLGLSLSDLRQIIPTSFSSLSSPTFHHSSFPVLQKKSPPEKIYFFFLLFFFAGPSSSLVPRPPPSDISSSSAADRCPSCGDAFDRGKKRRLVWPYLNFEMHNNKNLCG